MLILRLNARAIMHISPAHPMADNAIMRDWAIDYVLHVLEEKDWSMNRLAKETGLSASTINRPLRDKNWKGKLSRETLRKIQEKSGIDPSPFIPSGFSEERNVFASPAANTSAGRTLAALDAATEPEPQATSEIKIAIVGAHAQISATVDREGLVELRKKLDLLQEMMD